MKKLEVRDLIAILVICFSLILLGFFVWLDRNQINNAIEIVKITIVLVLGYYFGGKSKS
jgi:hypothetical protein